MGAIVYGCGCFISHSMFGGRECLNIHFCIQHVLDKKVQSKLGQLAALMSMQQKVNHKK